MKGYKSSGEYVKDLGEKIRLYRIAKGYSQKDLEDRSGVSMRSISRLEKGSTSIQLDNLIRILIALDLDENIDLLVPDQTKRPSYYLEEDKPQRVHKKKEASRKFVWGDER